MAFPPLPKPPIQLPKFTQDQMDTMFMWTVLGFGAWLAYKNYQSPDAKRYIEGDELYETVKRTLKTDAPHDDSLDIQSKRLDRIAKSFDEDLIERGTRFEMERTGGDELIAKRAAVENLTRDSDYYDGIKVIDEILSPRRVG